MFSSTIEAGGIAIGHMCQSVVAAVGLSKFLAWDVQDLGPLVPPYNFNFPTHSKRDSIVLSIDFNHQIQGQYDNNRPWHHGPQVDAATIGGELERGEIEVAQHSTIRTSPTSAPTPGQADLVGLPVQT